MLQPRSILTIADNTGAKKAMLVGIPGKGNRRYAYLGEIVTVVIKEAIPHGMVNKSEIHRAVIVRTKKEKRRSDGSYIRFDDNACVILAGKETKDPKGTRIFGPIAKEVKDNGFSKIASLAEEMY
jgi:large subunit ribosomal protein L14